MSVRRHSLSATTQAQPTLDLLVTREDGVPVVLLRGELDSTGGPLLTDFIDQIVRAEAPSALVLDLAGIDFICAAGIRALLLTRRTVTDNAGQLVLRNLSRLVGRVLAATGDLKYFQVIGPPAGAL